MARDHFESRPHPDGALDWNFNIIFDDQPQVGEMAEAYKPSLEHPALYPPVPTDWLHMTILRAGFVTEFSDQEMAAVADELKPDLANMRLPELTIGSPYLWLGIDNPVFRVSPEQPMTDVFTAVMGAMRKVVGDRTPQTHPFVPHVALAYNRDHNQEKELDQQLGESSIPPVKFRATKLSLIKQAQTLPFYQWEVIQSLPIGSQKQ